MQNTGQVQLLQKFAGLFETIDEGVFLGKVIFPWEHKLFIFKVSWEGSHAPTCMCRAHQVQ